tara:strand:+ start:660 stop:1151 length:492 start_codon:yes stop_codon:yes gene_type:complete
MHQKKIDQLSNKGWNDEEIRQAKSVLEKSVRQEIYWSNKVFWTIIVVIGLGNLICSLFLIPLLLFLNPWTLYSTVVFLAATIGFVYTFLMKDIEHLEKKHHLFAGLIIPFIALLNLIVIVFASNWIKDFYKTELPMYNPWIVGIVFMIVFMTPYLLKKFILKR